MKLMYDSLKELISPQMVELAASTLDEKKENVKKASSSIIAGLLGVMLKKGGTPQIKNILDEASNQNILADIENICKEEPTHEQQKVGDDFLQHLLGDMAADFTGPVAEKDGITKVAGNRLVSIIAPLVAGFLGNKLKEGDDNIHHLIVALQEERDSFKKDIPTGIINSFGLSSAFQEPIIKDEKMKAEKKKSNSTLIILLVLFILFFIIALFWRSCKDTPPAEKSREEVVVSSEGPAAATVSTESGQVVLPNGVKLNAAKGGIEDKMIAFLMSDEYTNATADELKNKWFEFDKIDFEYNSSTELMEGSQAQLNNIIEILKYFKDANVKIGAFADKKGTDAVNLKISEDRAKTIESILEKGGIEAQIVKVQGYGEEYAKHNTSESDAARATDRDIALRFVK